MSTLERDAAPEKGSREQRVAANAELEAMSDRLEALLRERRPDLFDEYGRLSDRALTKALIEHAGRTILTKAEVMQETPQLETAPRSARA